MLSFCKFSSIPFVVRDDKKRGGINCLESLENTDKIKLYLPLQGGMDKLVCPCGLNIRTDLESITKKDFTR
ncbi:MAG: hypothetical protein B6D34_02790 [Candidatus Brocadia sp. UTAMX1]|nr:MAG: hypothetical protein B6D34_02790 [Candidatus Brocadia sp. UTAMX1]